MKTYSGPPLRFTIHAVQQERQVSMPIETSEDEGEMRKHFKDICKQMPKLHVALYDGEVLIEERRPDASIN